MTELILPWPNNILSPNNRAHWARKAQAKKKQKQDAYYLALGKKPMIDGNIAVTLIFCPPTKRSRDADNLLASCKGMIDGIAEAWGIDDKIFRPVTVDFGPVVKHGRVIFRA